jgi:probable phosphoglycerate mutase
LPQRLAATRLDAIYSSPLQRAQETAQPLAQSKQLEIRTRDEFNEIDFGEWTGKSFSELDKISLWRQFNVCRGSTRIPGGENMLDVVHRMISAIECLQKLHQGTTIAVFSHADSIRAALTHYAGSNLDYLLRFEIEPASITVIDVDSCTPRILAVNDGCDIFRLGLA